MAGAETVQVYVKSPMAGAPNAQLKALKKVNLAPGESKTVKLHLSEKSFGVYNEEAERVIVPGEYEVYVGSSAPDKRSAALTGKAPEKFTLTAANAIVISE
jgi:beta-glucosidase